MYHELNLATADTKQIAAAILALRDNEQPLVIRAAGINHDLAFWENLLKNECGLLLDERQYQFDESLVHAMWWEISYQPDKATSYAYSNTPQPFHNDNAWFSDPAEINFFTMQRQALSGGEQVIYPLSRLISDLAQEDSGLFNDLCTIPVTIKKGHEDYENTTSIIELNSNRVFWNFYRTNKSDPHIENLCLRFFKFLAGKEQSSSTYKIRCNSGDCMAFNDQKLLHARTAFPATQPKERLLFQSMWRLPKETGGDTGAENL